MPKSKPTTAISATEEDLPLDERIAGCLKRRGQAMQRHDAAVDAGDVAAVKAADVELVEIAADLKALRKIAVGVNRRAEEAQKIEADKRMRARADGINRDLIPAFVSACREQSARIVAVVEAQEGLRKMARELGVAVQEVDGTIETDAGWHLEEGFRSSLVDAGLAPGLRARPGEGVDVISAGQDWAGKMSGAVRVAMRKAGLQP